MEFRQKQPLQLPHWYSGACKELFLLLGRAILLSPSFVLPLDSSPALPTHPLPVLSHSHLSQPTALLCSLASSAHALVIAWQSLLIPAVPHSQLPSRVYSHQLVWCMPTIRLSYYAERWRAACLELMSASFLSSRAKVSMVDTFQTSP